MRLLFGAAATALLLVPSAHPALSSCARPLPQAAGGLPAPVLVRTKCGNYLVQPDGTIASARPDAPHRPRGERLAMRRNHVVLIRNGRVVWRSRRTFGATEYAEAQALGVRHLAFSFYKGRLWIASRNGVERPIARGEQPYGWTAAEELVAVRWNRDFAAIVLRRSTGQKIRVVARHARSPVFDESTRTLLYTSPANELVRTDGRSESVLADLVALGVAKNPWIELLSGGLIAFQADDRLVVLRPDGSLFGSSLFPEIVLRPSGLGWTGWPTVAPGRIAFTIGERGPNDMTGYESVYVLREGQRAATRLYRTATSFESCGRMAELAWRGSWLLYSVSPFVRVVAIDSEGTARIDLTDIVLRLPGVLLTADGNADGLRAVAWA